MNPSVVVERMSASFTDTDFTVLSTPSKSVRSTPSKSADKEDSPEGENNKPPEVATPHKFYRYNF